MVDIVEPNVDGMEEVDIQVQSTPGVYTVDIIYMYLYNNKINTIYIRRSIVYFCFAYIQKLAPYKLQH